MTDDFSLRNRSLQSRDAVELLSDKWRITLLHLLTPGPQRAKALQQAITKISPKVLAQTLRGMERDGSLRDRGSACLYRESAKPRWSRNLQLSRIALPGAQAHRSRARPRARAAGDPPSGARYRPCKTAQKIGAACS
jgi:hypothetical protein